MLPAPLGSTPLLLSVSIVILLSVLTISLVRPGSFRPLVSHHYLLLSIPILSLLCVCFFVTDCIHLYILIIPVLPLCSLGRRPDGDVDRRWDCKTIGFSDLCQIKVVDVENAFQRVGSVSLDVGSESIFGGLMKIVVLRDELLELQKIDVVLGTFEA